MRKPGANATTASEIVANMSGSDRSFSRLDRDPRRPDAHTVLSATISRAQRLSHGFAYKMPWACTGSKSVVALYR